MVPVNFQIETQNNFLIYAKEYWWRTNGGLHLLEISLIVRSIVILNRVTIFQSQINGIQGCQQSFIFVMIIITTCLVVNNLNSCTPISLQ